MPRTGRRLQRHLGKLSLLGLAAAGAIAAVGCDSGADEACVSDEEFFARNVWAPVLGKTCIACHNPQGAAAQSKMVLKSSSEAGFLSTNMEIFRTVASFEQNEKSLVLLKPTGNLNHGGGLVIQEGSAEYNALSEMVERFKEPSSCEPDANAFFKGVQLASPRETLRMAALELAGRLPTPEEDAAAERGGMEAVDVILDSYMTEEAFYVRLKEIYNDLFLTDRYVFNEDGTDLLQSDTYDPFWYDHLPDDPTLMEKYGAQSADDLRGKLSWWTRFGVGREPLELITHVVREDRPFTEILTANYFMVNPFSAQAYGVWDATFQNDADPTEFAEAYRPDGFPHAGVLTSVMWLNRFPTTDTNRNRHRSRMVYQFFLGTDILKTAEQPLDSTKITDFNPTMNNPACVVCHARVDPIAGCFHSFDAMGDYNAADLWHDDMRPPGFAADKVPFEQFPNSLQWLGYHISGDPSFQLATVYTLLAGLTGQKPMISPAVGEADFQVKFDAYLAQYYLLNGIAERFKDSGYNLKTVVKEVIKSPYFRARNYGGEVTKERELQLEQLDSTRFLSPESLHRKIWAVTGYPWRYDPPYGGDWLLEFGAYRLLYGGIDNVDVIQRIDEPNGIMANISDRMANEVSCNTVPRDLALPTAERLLFPYVELSVEPQDANGYDIQPAIASIKQNIQHLHLRVLGERLDINDPEIERTYQLFLQTWQEGKAGMALNEGEEGYVPAWLPCNVSRDFWTGYDLPEDEQLNEDETYTVRAWMGVMTYLLSDFRFLYQ